MKKFIALGVALVTLLFSFIPAANAGDVNVGVQVCSDISPDPDPHDDIINDWM